MLRQPRNTGFSFSSFAFKAAQLLTLVALILTVAMEPADAARRKKKNTYAPKYSGLVIDATSGKVLYEQDANAERYPASLTKMMTLYMVFAALEKGQITLNQRMYVSAYAAAQPPSKLGLRAGDRLRVEDAILGLVTQSANDASVVFAEALGGTEARFATQMTQTARKLGMTKTVFKNANGLPNPAQVTTARDMAKLGLALLRHYPQYYPYFSTAGYDYEGTYHGNHNRLMARYEGMDGIKTGFINASGFNLVASAMRDGRRLVGVVFGGKTSKSRDAHMAGLMDAAFEKATRLEREQETRVASVTAPPATFTAPAPARKPETVLAALESPAVDAPEVVGQGDADEFSSPKAIPATATVDAAVIDNAIKAEPAVLTQQTPISKATMRAQLDKLPKNAWGVQIGAYNDRASGQRALAIVADQYASIVGNASARVISVDAANGTIYRARLVNMDEKTARQACAAMQRHKRSCLTLPPAGAPAAWLASAE